MPKSLVIVESPAKAKTLSRFLGKRLPRGGQLRPRPRPARERRRGARRDPRQALGQPGRRHRRRLQALLRRPGVEEAPRGRAPGGDEGRVRSAAGDRPRPRRASRSAGTSGKSSSRRSRSAGSTFHEITREAVQEAVANAHELDENLVKAQESRRILDRLYGYTLSPVLWKKVRTGLSAGRVQSVAVRLIVEREEARRAFRSSTYWDIEAHAVGRGPRVRRDARAGRRRAGGHGQGLRFGDRTAVGQGRAASERAGRRPRSRGALEAHLPWRVTAVDERPGDRAARAAVHDLDAHAGGEPQARVLDEPDDADRAAAEGRRGAGRRDDRGAHHLPPDRLDDDQREGADGVGPRHPRDVRRRVLLGAAPLPDAGAERAGSARGDPPDRLPRDAAERGERPRRGRTAALRPHLEADDGVADAGRAGAEDDRRVHGARAWTASRAC